MIVFSAFLALLLADSVLCYGFSKNPAVIQLTEPLEHGEGPTWDPRTGLLYFVDIKEGRVYSYNPETEESYYVHLDGTVSPLVQCEGDPHRFVVGVNRSVISMEWDGKHQIKCKKLLTTVAEDIPSSRFNDGKADSRGRLWFGTIGYENSSGVIPDDASLFLITKETLKHPKAAVKPVTVSNGLAWSKANDRFFYIDTPTYQIVEYDYDDASGAISNRRVGIDLKNLGASALPDGMTIDEDDNLWVALHGAGSVLQIDSRTWRILRRIAIPGRYVTSVMFGGRDLEVLFVTTSRVQMNAEQRLQQPAAGSLFAVTNLGTRGVPVFEATVC
ncbi:PREDICTED: putative sugar lactone lactonase YvrE [Nicrophorus vespilloides]|uniref:Sugar lactone lactonase YvrE n=1 Tax=Nicrophorus vespilloides TaxID=110193 RepID=A0ABM1ML35_NICVS|nr:PREDICTED: putative sugar lactone lactonase YvrE [Nicrophorus vespilloides]